MSVLYQDLNIFMDYAHSAIKARISYGIRVSIATLDAHLLASLLQGDTLEVKKKIAFMCWS